jgi:hypothetical protein
MVTNNSGPNELVSSSCFSMASDFQQHDNSANSSSIRIDAQQLQQQQSSQITTVVAQSRWKKMLIKIINL